MEFKDSKDHPKVVREPIAAYGIKGRLRDPKLFMEKDV